ncbi:helix-turn-helix transcriptional regulator, partial [Streptomyces sp. CRN 30]|uniref:helix-turn-helix domain-containing protein n=1 Tax=Streptomyces sp. CRN 30 TaxID=3075613 RepID=UPI002A836EBD
MTTEASAAARLALELRRLQTQAGGPSLRRLAQATHYSPSTLSRYFSAKQFPSLEVTRRLAGALGAGQPARKHLEGLWHEAAGERTRARAARGGAPEPLEGGGRTPPDTIETPGDLAGAL